jgi:hypothetical protein
VWPLVFGLHLLAGLRHTPGNGLVGSTAGGCSSRPCCATATSSSRRRRAADQLTGTVALPTPPPLT